MEIEVKARLDNPEDVIQKLTTIGCKLSDFKTQNDMIWVENVGSLETFLSNKVFLRIRVINNEKVILTAKKPKAKTGNESLVKREHEVIIESANEAKGILEMLGLQEAVRVKKTRRTTCYKDFEICLDEVDNLGFFIELEKLDTEDNAEKTQEEMIDFLAELGIPESNRVMKGYDILMLERQTG